MIKFYKNNSDYYTVSFKHTGLIRTGRIRTKEFLDKIFESKTELLFALKSDDGDIYRFAEFIWRAMNPPNNYKFEDFQEAWIKFEKPLTPDPK